MVTYHSSLVRQALVLDVPLEIILTTDWVDHLVSRLGLTFSIRDATAQTRLLLLQLMVLLQ